MSRAILLCSIILIIVQLVSSARIIRDAPPPTDNPDMEMSTPAAAPLDLNALLEKIKGLFSQEGLMQIKEQLNNIGTQLQATATQFHETLQDKVKQLHSGNMK